MQVIYKEFIGNIVYNVDTGIYSIAMRSNKLVPLHDFICFGQTMEKLWEDIKKECE